MNVKSFKVIINRFHFNKFGAGAGGSYSYSLGLIIGCIILFVGKGPNSRGIKGSMYDSGKLPTYPSPSPIFCPK